MKQTSDIIKSYKTSNGKIRYGFDFQLKGIRVRRQSFVSADEAYAMMLQIRLDIFKGDYIPSKYFQLQNKDITLENFYIQFHQKKKKTEVKNRTYKNLNSVFINYIIPEIGNLKLRSIDISVLEKYFLHLTELGLAKSTQKIHWNNISGLLRYAEELGFIDSKPRFTKKMELKKSKKFLTKKEASQVLRTLNSSDEIQQEVKNIINILFFLGLRIGEAIALKKEDFDFRNNRVLISRTMGYASNGTTTTKNGKSEYIPLHPEVIESIKSQIEISDNDEGFLFKRDHYRKDCFLRPVTIRKSLVKIAISVLGETEGKKVTPHCLRRSLASMLVDSNLPIDMVASMLRHDTETLLKSYNQANIKMLSEKFQTFSIH